MNNALGNNNGSSSSAEQQLIRMGFDRSASRAALQRHNGNVERAIEDLTSSTSSSTSTAMQHTANQAEQDDIQRAIQASMMETTNLNRQQSSSAAVPVRSAASRKAGQAALSRFSNNGSSSKSTSTSATANKSTLLSHTHPNVQVPKTMEQTPTQQVILRCAQRLAPHVHAVDTLLRALVTLRDQPNHKKFQTIDTSTQAFQRNLTAPGAQDFLRAMQYRPWGNHQLQLSHYDAAAIYLGISALEQAKLSLEYRQNKSWQVFEKELESYLTLADTSTDEAIQRSHYMKQCPSEPTSGGVICTIHLGRPTSTTLLQVEQQQSKKKIPSVLSRTKVSRKFEADDVLENVVHFLASHGTPILDKLQSGEWWLVDKQNLRNNHPQPLDIVQQATHTLQRVGCWPSGQFQLLPKPITE